MQEQSSHPQHDIRGGCLLQRTKAKLTCSTQEAAKGQAGSTGVHVTHSDTVTANLVQHDVKRALLLQRPGKINWHEADAVRGR